MATVIDLLNKDPRKKAVSSVRHPEKAHRADQPMMQKPDWIRDGFIKPLVQNVVAP